MMLRHDERDDDQVRDEAAHWAVWCDKGVGTEAERVAFEAWLAEPGNLEAYDRTSLALELLDDYDLNEFPELRALHTEAQEHMRSPRRWLPVAGVALAASLVAAVGLSSLPYWRSSLSPLVTTAPTAQASRPIATSTQLASAPSPHSFATAVGEQRVVMLADGTKVTMDTNTQIAVAYSPVHRVVRLLHGQALFDVFHNAKRPFSVVAGGRQVTALGTIFEVRNERGGFAVTLIKGRVVVDHQNLTSTAAMPAPTYLAPGQKFTEAPAIAAQVSAVDLSKALLWQQSLVEFTDQSMSSAVAELNRYSTQPIVIADPQVQALRISGVFHTGDPEGFADLVSKMLPIQSRENARGEIELYSGSKGPR